MSRTWRKAPQRVGKQARPPRQKHRGGATASAGPSPERRRPDANYDAETLQLAADLLERTADQVERCGTPRFATAAEALWHTAATEEYPADALMPTVHVARLALKQVSVDDEEPTPEIFTRASTLLQHAVNAKGEIPAPRAKAYMVPDGQQNSTRIPFWRDNRVTGLRAADHRQARREARRGLADPASAETVRAGKGRRYTDKYGEYDL